MKLLWHLVLAPFNALKETIDWQHKEGLLVFSVFAS